MFTRSLAPRVSAPSGGEWSFSGHAEKGLDIGPSSTYDSLQSSSCTSCEIEKDLSAYWTPLLYYEHANGSFEEVPNGGMAVYYLGRGDNKTNIQPFPPGFRMLSGDAAARSFNDTPVSSVEGAEPYGNRVSFNCLTDSPNPQSPQMNMTDCDNGLRAQIQFQSCWDGVNKYLPDNSHVGKLNLRLYSSQPALTDPSLYVYHRQWRLPSGVSGSAYASVL